MTAVRWCKRCGEQEACPRSSFCPSCHKELDGVEVAQVEAPSGLQLLADRYGEEVLHGD